MGKDKKYVAMIMNKNYINSYSFIFNPINVAVGVVDEKTGVLKDKNGNEYLAMNNPNFLFSDIPYSYFNIVELDELKEMMRFEGTLTEAVSEFYKRCSDLFYYSTIDNKGEVSFFSFNHRSLRETIESVDDLPASNNNDSAESDTPTKDEKKTECYDDISTILNDIMLRIINDEYSYEELLELQNELKIQQEGCEAALLSVDMKLEAMGSDENGNFYLNENESSEKEEKCQSGLKLVKNKEKGNTEIKTDDLIDISDLYDKVTKTLIAQDAPALRLIVEIARMYADNENKDGILLTGSTGVGKTKLMSLIAKYLDRPFLAVDSTQLTIPGYVGKNIEQVLWELYVSCGKDKKKAESAIVFFDEIDKKGSKNKSDIAGQGVLNVLLKFLDGTTYTACQDIQHLGGDNSVNIDTSNMMVIAGGAFADVYNVYRHLPNKKSVGFEIDSSVNKETTREPKLEDFVEIAMVPEEFMGRMPVIIHLNDLTQESMKRILNESDESPIKREEKRFSRAGVKLKVTEDYLDVISQKAFELRTGARGLKSIIADTTWRPFYEVSCNKGVYDEVVLDAKNDEDGKKKEASYQLVKRRNTSLINGNNMGRK